MELQQGHCPKCGKQLQIPAELEEFSCLYCGARLNRASLREKPATVQDLQRDYELFATQALHAAVGYPQSMENMSKPQFFPYFDRYYSENKTAFEALERWVLSREADREALLSQAAAFLMERINAWFPTQKQWKHRTQREELRDRTKFTIAIFLVPTARRCAPAIGETFCEKLRVQWLACYPNSPFELATYEQLSEGFRKRPFCFITTAVCRDAGLPDDCEMLTDFRAFRDGYLRACPDGEALIAEYYDCAPGIVSRIEFCENKKQVYDALLRDDLIPCHEALREGNPAKCRSLYIRMMEKLKN